jgi:hypothetical protein
MQDLERRQPLFRGQTGAAATQPFGVFDHARASKYLQKLKWPRTTVSQSAGVLMRRDGTN